MISPDNVACTVGGSVVLDDDFIDKGRFLTDQAVQALSNIIFMIINGAKNRYHALIDHRLLLLLNNIKFSEKVDDIHSQCRHV